jgi:hypothetical protein
MARRSLSPQPDAVLGGTVAEAEPGAVLSAQLGDAPGPAAAALAAGQFGGTLTLRVLHR